MYFSPCVLSVSVALILIDNVKYFALDKLIQPKKKIDFSAPHSERSTKHINITYLIFFFFLTRKSKMPLIYFDSKLCARVFKMLLILYKGYSRNGKGFDWLLDTLCIWWLHYQGLTQLWSLLSKARLITLGLWLISSSMQCTVPISVAKLCLATLQP